MSNPSIDDIKKQVVSLSIPSSLPDGTFCNIITISDTELIAKNFKVTLITVEITAIKNKIIPERYMRNMKTFSFDNQLKLLKASVCIVGLGGLGGLVLENLARIGIGHFRLIDGDIFETHNLNRQLLSSNHNLGKTKTSIALKRLAKINPAVNALTLTQYLSENNSKKLIGSCAVAVDCLDNIKARFILEAETKRKNIPLVSAAIAGTTGHITTIFPNDKGLSLIFGKIPDSTKQNKGAESALGCPPHTASTIASLQCNETINIILNKKTLKNKLLVVDLEDYTFETLNLT